MSILQQWSGLLIARKSHPSSYQKIPVLSQNAPSSEAMDDMTSPSGLIIHFEKLERMHSTCFN